MGKNPAIMAGRPGHLPKWHKKSFKSSDRTTDNLKMNHRRRLTTGERMLQWIGVLIALIGLAYNGVKDYQKGDIKLPVLPQKQLTKRVYPVQYCLMAYDPNLKRVFYLHDNGQWYDFPPKIREYPDQGQEALGASNGPQGGSSRYHYGQQAQATAYTTRY